MRDLLKEALSPETSEPTSKSASKCALKSPNVCPKCHGLGVVMSAMSALATADLCQCLKNCTTCGGRAREIEGSSSKPCRIPGPIKIKNILNSAYIPAKYATATFDTFDNFTGNGRNIAGNLNTWAQQFNPKKPQGLLLTGPVGV